MCICVDSLSVMAFRTSSVVLLLVILSFFLRIQAQRSLVTDRKSLVINEPSKKIGSRAFNLDFSEMKPEVLEWKVNSNIFFRYARTVINSTVNNPSYSAKQVSFDVRLPRKAFISAFCIIIESQVFHAYVQEKDQARKEYNEALLSKITAAHIKLNAPDTNNFTVSINIEPLSNVTFELTYEELLDRHVGHYEHVITISPGQVVPVLRITINIKESRNITFYHVPDLRTGNEINAEVDSHSSLLAIIHQHSPTELEVKFFPSRDDQKSLSRIHGLPLGSLGQFVVQYDVARDKNAGEALMNNEYFVHFIAPEGLDPLRIHAIFLLDVSKQMEGQQMESMKEAMLFILDQMGKETYFNFVKFSNYAVYWDPDDSSKDSSESPYPCEDKREQPRKIYEASQTNVKLAKKYIRNLKVEGEESDIFEGLNEGMVLARQGVSYFLKLGILTFRPEIIVVVITSKRNFTKDELRPEDALESVRKYANKTKTNIFSLAFGADADYKFLRNLSLSNSGFVRRLYENSDIQYQISKIMEEVAFPLLSQVKVFYPENEVQNVTRSEFQVFYNGSELAIAGKLQKKQNAHLTGKISGITFNDTFEANFTVPAVVHNPASENFLKRIWAFLTIKQLLDLEANSTHHKVKDDKLKARILELSLEYSFVTPYTSLVITKPGYRKTTYDQELQVSPRKVAAGEGRKSRSSFLMMSKSRSNNLAISHLQSQAKVKDNDDHSVFREFPNLFLQKTSDDDDDDDVASMSVMSIFQNSFGHQSSLFGTSPFGAMSFANFDEFPSPFDLITWTPSDKKPEMCLDYKTRKLRRPRAAHDDDRDYNEETYKAINKDDDDDIVKSVGAPPQVAAALASFPAANSNQSGKPQENKDDYDLVEVQDLEWIPDLITERGILFPYKTSKMTKGQEYYVQDKNSAINSNRYSCTTPTHSGGCRFLSFCSLKAFQKKVEVYLDNYFCEIGSFAGTCCPKAVKFMDDE